MTMTFQEFWRKKKPVIGMVHLKALPGSPRSVLSLNEIYELAMRDADALIEGGVDAVQVENQFDTPYRLSDEIGPETVAFLAVAADKIKMHFPEIPLGITAHLNGGVQALAVARAVHADFIRCFNLMNAYISNSGFVGAAAPELMRYRRQIGADNIMVFGDFQVKHGSHAITADRSLLEKAHDIAVSGAEAAILTGTATGVAPDAMLLSKLSGNLPIPVLIGSGLNEKNAMALWPHASGAIIGSGFKPNGDLSAPVDYNLVRAFMQIIR
jgi:uncharacterized protein